MDPLSPSNANNSSFGENFSNYVKSAKGRRVAKLAVSTLAIAGGVTAAVVFFAVPSVALSPVLAITAMVVGAIGLRHLINTLLFAYRTYQAKKNTVIDTTPSAPSINVATLPPLKLGAQALAKKAVKYPDVTAMSHSQLNKVLKAYSEFDGSNSNQATTTVRTLLEQAYNEGRLQGTTEEPFYKQRDEIQKMTYFIFENLIVQGAKPTEKQTGLALILGTAFQSCPAERYRSLIQASGEILGSQGEIPDQLHAEWNNRKMSLLNKMILQRHPACNNSGQAMSAQFPHLKSAYVVQFGQELGLNQAEINVAEGDTKKPYNVSDAGFVQDFRNQLQRQLNEFLAFIVQDTNRVLNPNNKQQQKPLLDRVEFMSWLTKKREILPSLFCLYSEDKDYNYPGKAGTCSWKATEEQESYMQPMMTLEEGTVLLQYFEVEIAG
jgi:hypothetical protein